MFEASLINNYREGSISPERKVSACLTKAYFGCSDSYLIVLKFVVSCIVYDNIKLPSEKYQSKPILSQIIIYLVIDVETNEAALKGLLFLLLVKQL